jgi:hypothetical protein
MRGRDTMSVCDVRLLPAPGASRVSVHASPADAQALEKETEVRIGATIGGKGIANE